MFGKNRSVAARLNGFAIGKLGMACLRYLQQRGYAPPCPAVIAFDAPVGEAKALCKLNEK